MTTEEKIIATGFTAVNFMYEFSDFHKDLEKRIGRKVQTAEIPLLEREIKELYREDFIKMCTQ